MSTNSKRLSRAYPAEKGCVTLYQALINFMPRHEVYIEAFMGGGSVFLHKKPALRNVGIDLDEGIIAAWRKRNYSGLEVVHADAIEFLNRWPWSKTDKTRTLVYCDPPYPADVRHSKRKMYRCELLNREEHIKLLTTLKSLPCMVVLSGYSSPLYESLLRDWRRVHFQPGNRTWHGTPKTIWMNFPESLQLHDYQYSGRGFRERRR
jgi:DNA adenine methylase